LLTRFERGYVIDSTSPQTWALPRSRPEFAGVSQEVQDLERLLRHSVIGLCLALFALTFPLANTAAATGQASSTTRNGPDASTAEASQTVVQRHAAELASLQLDIQNARPFLSVDANGTFHVADGYKPRAGGLDVRAQLNALNSQMRDFQDQQQRAQLLRAAGLAISAQAYWCYYVPNWALDAFAWYIIIVGGVAATASLFLDVTVIGIPLGIVLGVLGIWVGVTGGFLLWYFDKYYPNGAWICH
jgi:hypothetical protein